MCQNLNNEKIQELRHERYLIKSQIKARVKKNRDAKSLVIEYFELTNELAKLGFSVPAKKDYLTLEYWGLTENDLFKDSVPAQVQHKSPQKTTNTPDIKINIEPEQNYYIFNLAWTEVDSEDLSQILQMVQNYLAKMGLVKVTTETNTNTFRTEYMIQYKYKCEESVYKIIRRSAQFMIDNLGSELTSQNVAIFGRKQEIN